MVWYTAGGSIPSNIQSELVNVIEIYSNYGAFAALRSDGTVRAWGHPSSMPVRVVVHGMLNDGWMARRGMVHVAADAMWC